MSAEAFRPVAYVLVENGLHAGARLELRDAGVWYSAGGLVDAEYWLADPDLVEAKAEFAYIDGVVHARLLAGPTMLLGTASVEAGAPVPFDRGLLWGGVSFRAVAMPSPTEPQVQAATKAAAAPVPEGSAALAAALRSAGRRAGSRRSAMLLVAVLAVVVPAAITLSLLGSMLERHQHREAQREALFAQEDPGVRLNHARSAAQRLSDLIGMQAVSVAALDGRTLAVFGTNVPPERRDSVRASIAQFETEYSVRDNVSYRSDAAPRAFRLTQLPEGVDLVQYGPEGYLRGREGRLYLPGGTLPDGAQVDLIREDEVWLRRGQERAVLRATDLDH